MIHVVKLPVVDRQKHLISDVIEEFGAWRVLAAAVRSLLRRKPGRSRLEASELSSHLRRDVGLPPVHVQPRYWDIG